MTQPRTAIDTGVRLRNYLTGPFLRFQQSAFPDREHGGFFEKLDKDGTPAPGSKRLLVQCRQLFVQSAAALHLDLELEPAADRGFEFLVERYRDPDHGGWYFAVDASGDATDFKKDLYAHAFVVFALSHYAEASGNHDAKTAVDDTLAVIDERFRAAHGGFAEACSAEWEPLAAMRRQNPHMHLLEGCLAQWQFSGTKPVLTDELIALLSDAFYDAETETLGEFFADDWRPHPEQGHIVEPGHHFEWAWLLDWYARLSGDDAVLAIADSLFAWGCRHGVDRNRGGVFDEVDRSGQLLRATRRIWPQTEYLKALAVQLRRTQRSDLSARLIAASEQLCDDYLLDDGRWHEHLDESGQSIRQELPGTSGYHIFLGLLEASSALAKVGADPQGN